jgi:hypothetical protein
MPNRNLTPDELKSANDLLAEIRNRLVTLAGDDPLLLFAYRRKVMKELGYDERSKPGVRAKLKAMKWRLQNGRCAECGREMPLKYSELDRRNAADRLSRNFLWSNANGMAVDCVKRYSVRVPPPAGKMRDLVNG